MLPTGLVLGNDARASVREMVEDAERAERAGLGTVFFSESMSSHRDSVSALAAFALATERIQLAAIQVARLRTPLMLAQTAATLDELSGGRLSLALGAFTRRHAARHGVDPSKPETTLHEYVEVFRQLLTGEAVTYEGEYIRMRGTALAWTPVRMRIPIWIAANSVEGLATAARFGDAVLLDGATSPEYTASAVRRVREAAAGAGRDLSGFRVAQLINVSIAGTRREALDAVRGEIAARFRSPQPAAAKLAVGEPHLDAEQVARHVETFRERGADALGRRFPEDLLLALSASGTPDEVHERVDRYRAAGVDLPLLRPAAPSQLDALLETFGASGA